MRSILRPLRLSFALMILACLLGVLSACGHIQGQGQQCDPTAKTDTCPKGLTCHRSCCGIPVPKDDPRLKQGTCQKPGDETMIP